MIRWIVRKKKEIAFMSGGLIGAAYGMRFGLNQSDVSDVLLVVASCVGMLPIFIQAVQALRVRVVSIELLVTAAVLGAFLIQNYEESAIVTFLFLFGSFLEQRTINRTRSAIKELTEMVPENALLLMDDGNFEAVPVDEVMIGDVLLVKTGAKVPVDGIVTMGEAYINESSITGESFPVFKDRGTFVYAGTFVENGTLQMATEKVGSDTTFGKIIELVEEAQDSKSPAVRFIDRFARYYTPIVLVLSLLIYAVTRNVETSITVLVLGCPGALVIGVPVSNVSGIGNGAKNGILLKGSETINAFSKIDTFVFDKTGTLTIGNSQVSTVIAYETDNAETLSFLANIEAESDHPLGTALLDYIGEYEKYNVENTLVFKGCGIVATINGKEVIAGNEMLMKQYGVISDAVLRQDIDALEMMGNSIVLVAVNGVIKCAIGVKDQIRPDVKKSLTALKKLGVNRFVVLSGDNQGTVDHVAEALGLDEVYGNMLPEDKAAFIRELQNEGSRVAFVGDGINDSPSLALADIGIAMGNGTDVAIETSDVVLMNSKFSRIVHAFGLSKAIVYNMTQNIMIAVGVVVMLLLSLIFSDWMTTTVGMLVHEGSILVVIFNGMRLLRYQNS